MLVSLKEGRKVGVLSGGSVVREIVGLEEEVLAFDLLTLKMMTEMWQ